MKKILLPIITTFLFISTITIVNDAIIDKETFDWVQNEMERRKIGVFANKGINTTCFTSKIKCGNCGKSYRRTTRSRTEGRYKIWTCRTKLEKGIDICKAKDIPEKQLMKFVCKVLNLEKFDEEVFLGEIKTIVIIGEDNLKFIFF